jgi:quinoprotein glucose dehydrogenase
VVQLISRAQYHAASAMREDMRLKRDYEYNEMIGTPYVMRRRILTGPSGAPCTPPPFGTLVAIDLKTGQRLWDVPLGSPSALMDSTATIPAGLGSPNLGGPIVTAGGLVFIGAALDRSLHAYDIETGRELWRGRLPASGKATPMSYRSGSGEQFVAIAVGGGDVFGTGDYVIDFHLPPANSPTQERTDGR